MEKKCFSAILWFLFVMLLFATEDSTILDDKIIDVVIYPSQAMITRSTELVLEKGLHKLIFDNIPQSYEEASIQVKGFGNAEIKDIKKVKNFEKAEFDQRRQELYDKLEKIGDNIRIQQDDLNLANEEKNVIKDILKKVTSPDSKEEKTELDPQKWRQMTDFYKKEQIGINKKIREKEKILKNLNEDKKMIQNQLNQLGHKKNKIKKQVEVLLNATKSGKVKLLLSYLVYNSSWKPKYDIRVSSDNKIMKLIYKGEIKQNTGEDWENVNLKISTAQPQIGGEHPELDPWRLNIYEPQDLSVEDIENIIALQSEVDIVSRELHIRGGRANEVTYSVDGMSVSDPAYGDMNINKTPEISKMISIPRSNLTSSIFEISGEKTISADNQEYSVTISISDFPAVFRYSTVPKLSQHAFLKAKVENTSEFPFLPGSANIFLDDNFVASSFFDYAAPAEEFWTFLGVDAGISVEYKFIKKFKEKSGILAKKEKINFDYEIILKNNKKTEEDIVIWDQIPISSDKEIKIELIEPEYQKDTNELKLTKENFLEWHYVLKPGEEKTIPLKFSVEYPKNKNIQGL